MANNIYIGLGSNLGNKSNNIYKARTLISELEGVKLQAQSSLYKTKAWGKTDQDDFINQVIALDTSLAPLDLLHKLQDIEIKLGRHRDEKWGPRVIDLDILLYDGETIHEEELQVPHPYLMQRLFVLVPLREINSELEFPNGSKIGEVLSRVQAYTDGNDIQKL